MIAASLKRTRIWGLNPAGRLLLVVGFAVSLLPLVNIIRIIATAGDNTPSSDDAFFFGRFLNQVLDGAYNWLDFPRDTFFNTHSSLVPGLAAILLARLTDYNLYSVLYVGIGLAAIKLVLMQSSFTRGSNSGALLPRLVLWFLLAAFVFSPSQISTFEHDFQTLIHGLNLLGVSLGVWGLARFPGRWAGVGVMAAGGAIATLSFGNGPLVWPVLLGGLILLGFRRRGHYAVWLMAAVVSSLPYLYILDQPAGGQTTVVSLFNYRFIVGMIGRPLADNIGSQYLDLSMANISGAVGLVLFLAGVALLFGKGRTTARRQAAPALMLVAFALLTAWQISIFRPMIAPWYSAQAAVFWYGLFGLGYALWDNRRNEAEARRPRAALVTKLIVSWCLVTLMTTSALYLLTNRTYGDKSFFLRLRAPVSAACVRNYRSAPTYGEVTLIPWHPGNPEYLSALAETVERHHLSAFAPRQRWTLQGDFILDSVKVHEVAGVPDVAWSADLTNNRVKFTDYHHLNLFVHTPNSVSWTVSLPSDLKSAAFHSAVAISESAPLDPAADGLTFEVHIQPAGGADTVAFFRSVAASDRDWQEFSVDLAGYAGQTITLTLTSSPGLSNAFDWAMFRFPFIDLETERSDIITEPAQMILPSNTDLSPAFTRPTPGDYRFEITDPGVWEAKGLQPVANGNAGAGTWSVGGAGSSLRLVRPIDLRLADYTHFYVRMAASFETFPRAMKIFYMLDDMGGFDDSHSVIIPLLAGGEMHEYTYDLKLLELDQGARLTGIMIEPLQGPAISGANQIQITDFRLIRADDHGSP